MPDTQRADARRNYTRILAVAEAEVARHGAAASLEQIARTAGVGSATVRRHFPTRRALLEAVSRQRIESLGDRARARCGDEDSRGALLAWLHELVDYCVAARGLAAALSYDGADPESVHDNACSAALEQAAAPLVERAVQDGAVAAELTVADLITLVVGITLATEPYPDHAGRADRLFRLTISGLAPGNRSTGPHDDFRK